jgi:hypothetical protein
VKTSLKLVIAITFLGLISATAHAEPFPAQHLALAAMGAEPLRTGFVEVIHPEGPEVYAHQLYALNGASPHESYLVVISIWTSSLTCSGGSIVEIPAALMVTNASGNGRSDVVFTPEMVSGLRNLTISATVTLLKAGTSPAYTTGCRVLELD